MKILAHEFVVTDADEHTLHFMESNERSWPFSSPTYLKDKLQCAIESIRRAMLIQPQLSAKYITRDDLYLFVYRASGIDLNLQELVTLFRTLDVLKTGKVKLSIILKFIQSNGVSED